jgi:hypothetical protein
MCYVTYHMLEQVLKVTTFNSQIYLTCSEVIIEYCLKLLSRHHTYSMPDETPGA